MHSAARRVTGLQCQQLLQVERQLLQTSDKRKSHTNYCDEHNYNRLQSIEQHQALQRSRLTRTTILPLNAYDWREPNEKSPDDDIWVNTVILHDQSATTEERLSTNEIRLLRSTTRWKFTYEGEAIEAHFRWKSVYCDRILDVRLPFRRIHTAMTAYATRWKLLAINWHRKKSIPVERIPFLRIQSPIPTMLQTRMPCTRHLVAIRNYYQSWTTIKRPGNERIPNLSCGTMLTASFSLHRDGNQVSQWLALGAHWYRDFLISRLFLPPTLGWGNVYRPPVHGWGRCMQSKFGALTVPARN